MASEILPPFVDRLLQTAGLKIEDLQMTIPHQASLMAMRLICKQLGIDPEKFMTIIQTRGNYDRCLGTDGTARMYPPTEDK